MATAVRTNEVVAPPAIQPRTERGARDFFMRLLKARLAGIGLFIVIGLTLSAVFAALIAALGASLQDAIIAVGIIGIPTYARLTRGQVLTVKEREFVIAARTVGARDVRIILRHILPNITAPLIVQSSLGIAFAILAE